jgi:PAS domain S-box-containing protein
MPHNNQPKAIKPSSNILDITYNLVNQHPDIVIVTDVNWGIEYVNNAIFHETGEKPHALIGRNLNEWLSESYGNDVQYKLFWDAIESGKSWSGTFYRRAYEKKRKWEQITTSPVVFSNDNSFHMTIIIKNIDKKKLLEEEQKKNRRLEIKKIINSRDSIIIGVIEGEERERRKIASDLHDVLEQILAAAKYCLEGLSGVIPIKYEDEFKMCCDLLGNAITETSHISHILLPTSLADFGLIEALDDLCKHTLLVNGQSITFECKKQENLKFEIFKEMMIFRIVEEGINNIQKHSGASQAMISLKKENDFIRLLISDNGLGFEMKDAKNSLGLMRIYNRTKLLGGHCKIKSEIGNGTQIRISFHHKTIAK